MELLSLKAQFIDGGGGDDYTLIGSVRYITLNFYLVMCSLICEKNMQRWWKNNI